MITAAEEQSEAATSSMMNNSTAASLEAEASMRIISEFKQKPFDELKQTLIKTNQSYVNTDKYQQVLDLISREIHGEAASTSTVGAAAGSTSSTGTAGGVGGVGLVGQTLVNAATAVASTTSTGFAPPSTTGNNVAAVSGGGSYTNISLSNLKNTSISSMSSNQSASMSSSNILINSRDVPLSNNAQKTIPLNDIDFPKLFMF
jgi:hypothetical protein